MGMLSEEAIAQKVHELVLANVPDEPCESSVPSSPLWAAVREAGTRLWLDTGDIDEISELWSGEFSALTTNNTLLNKEVQKGIYDDLVGNVAAELKGSVPEDRLILELAFVLNAVHGLRLHRRFGAMVSVELHTDLAHDADGSEAVGRRFHAICPDGFYVKIGLTPAGLIAARRLSDDGIGVNFTLGFSARQNVLITNVARPAYCNVFLGRLKSLVDENGLGSGRRVGEKATLASQRAVSAINDRIGTSTLQIAAAMREAEQVAGLLGVDVHTMPPSCLRAYRDSNPQPESMTSQVANDPEPDIHADVDQRALGITDFWDVPDALHEACRELGEQNVGAMAAGDLVVFMADRGFGNLLPDWAEEDVAATAEDGKIVVIEHWKDRLASGDVALDSLMNLAGLVGFTADQKAMDDRIRSKI